LVRTFGDWRLCMVGCLSARIKTREAKMTPCNRAKRLTVLFLTGCLLIAATSTTVAEERPRRVHGGQVVSVQVFTSHSTTSVEVGSNAVATKLPAPLFIYTKHSPTSILKVTYEDHV